jgi:hypothetical protein
MRFPETLRSLVAWGPPGAVARLRFRFYSVFVLLGLPNMLVFGVLGVRAGHYQMAALVLASALGLTLGWFRLRAGHDDAQVYRVNALVFGLLALEMVAIGGEWGSKSLWVFVYPAIAFFLFGEREGAVWAGALGLAVAAMLWLPLPDGFVQPYPTAFGVRLLVMYAVMSAITAGFEYSRRKYRDAMLREQDQLRRDQLRLSEEIRERERVERDREALIQELQETLAQVKTLKGLVPICASCHRIRDDRGFWNQLETYLHEHSDARFSHGICPTCMGQLYPDYKE